MKLFKRIYFISITVLLALAVVFSFVGNSLSFKSSPLKADAVKELAAKIAYQNADALQSEITKNLADSGISLATGSKLNTSGKNEAKTALSGTTKLPTYVVQTNTLTTAEHREYLLAADEDATTAIADTEVNNIVVFLPSAEADAKTALIVLPYDNVSASGAAAVAAALGTIKEMSTCERTNNLLFLFADSSETGAGTFAFLNKFVGFDNVVSSVTTVVSYDMSGNSGIVSLSAVDAENYNTLALIAKAGVISSSFAEAFCATVESGADYVAALAKNISYALTNNGGKEYANAHGDTIDNLKNSLINNISASVYNVAKTLAVSNIDLNSKEGSFVYFNYLGLITVAYPVLAAMILLALIVGLLAAIVIVNLKVKAFDFTKAAWGTLGALCSIVATAITLFVVYLLTTLMMSGFGVISFRNIFNLGYSSAGLIIGAALLTIALSIGFSALFKRIFNTKSYDLVLGNALITAVIAVVAGFVIPKAAYALTAIATLELAVILANTIFKNKFKAKYNFDITRLFLVFVPIVLVSPIIISSLLTAGTVLGAMWYPVIFAAFALCAGFVTPYFTLLNPIFEAVFKKLPKETVRIQRIERVEILPATKVPKKGKNSNPAPVFEDRKVITKEKRERKYSIHYVSGLIAIISCAVIICFAAGGNLNANYSKVAPNAYLDNALVYHVDTSAGTASWEVYDLKAYNYISRAVGGFKWDGEKQAFSKVDYQDKDKISGKPTNSTSSKITTITPYDGYNSNIVIKITFTTRPTTMKIKDSAANEIFSLDPTASDKTIEIALPKGVGEFKIEVTGSMSASVEYAEYNQVPATLNAFAGWVDFADYYSGSEILDSINSVLLITKNFNI